MQDLQASFKDYTSSYFSTVKNTLDKINTNRFSDAFSLVLKTIVSSGNIYFIGNGGSAGTANHLVNDLLIGLKKRINLDVKAISLCANSPVMTCISNDIGYDEVFSKQLEPVAQKGDLIIAISASGNSPNIVKALEFAQTKNIPVIGITGFDGGYLKKMCTQSIHIPTEIGDYEVAEDVHLMVGHIMSTYICKHLKSFVQNGRCLVNKKEQEVIFN
jgi:D-sedoheptulose 7-phosphate isomerase